jgi:hypothetical protein
MLRLVLALGAVALGVWLWLALFPSPEKVITRRLDKLARAASISPGAGSLARLAGAQEVGGYFADNVEIYIDTPARQQHGALSREDIVQAMLAAPAAGGLQVKFPDIIVSVAADQLTAQADVTVEARVPGERDMMAQAMRFSLSKIDGKWLITRVQTVRSLS